MTDRFARYRTVAAFADAPTPRHRLIAAIWAGALAFGLTQLLFGIILRAGAGAVLFSSVALAIAAAVAAGTMKRAMAIAYGVLGAIWLLAECLALVLGCIAAGLG
jgi:hypothetical protein